MSDQLPASADVVVIGTGAFGLSVVSQLARLGVSRVLAVDQFEIGSQTSPRAAGLFKLVQADELRTRLATLAVETVRELAQEAHQTDLFVASGSLLLARNERSSRLIEQEVMAARRWGVEVELVSSDEARRLAPYLEGGTIERAAYVPGDIYIEEPARLLETYRILAERHGATIVGRVPVLGIELEGGSVVAVRTAHGTIRTPIVVDAAGAWVRHVARLAGSDLPVVPVRHQLAITAPIPGVSPRYPITRIIDAAVYVRPCRGGLMWGGFEANPLPFDLAERQGFRIEELPLDFGILQGMAEDVRDVVPSLHDAEIGEHRGGLFTMTPDGRFVVGPVPEVSGMWVLSGCNGSGFSFSPALGRLLAEWIVRGQPSIDLTPLSVSRWTRQLSEDELRAAAVWQYTHYYEPAES